MAGFLLFVLTEHTDRFFSWTIEPPLTAAFLGACYWAACVLIFIASKNRLWAAARPAMPPVLAIATLLLVAVMLVLGVWLFVAPGDAGSAWPWKLTPLTAQAVGAFVSGFGLAAADAALTNDAVRFKGAALAYLALGALELVAVARYSGDLDETLPSVLYVAFLCSVVVVSLLGWRSASRPSAAS